MRILLSCANSRFKAFLFNAGFNNYWFSIVRPIPVLGLFCGNPFKNPSMSVRFQVQFQYPVWGLSSMVGTMKELPMWA